MERKAYLQYLELAKSLFIVLMFILPILAFAQNADTIKRLDRFGSYHVFSGTGPDSSGNNTVVVNYDPVNPFQVNSYRKYGNYYLYDTPFDSWDETYPFTGYTQHDNGRFIYSIPTMQGYVRTIVFNEEGYVLEDNYSATQSPQDYLLTNQFFYNSNMKFLSKLRTNTQTGKFWKTECMLDSLDRRIEETHYKSEDSVNWIPTMRNEYSYTGDPLLTTCHFEKYNMYIPDPAFMLPLSYWDINYGDTFESIYMCDNWAMDLVTRSYFYNQEWHTASVRSYALFHDWSGYHIDNNYDCEPGCIWDDEGMPIELWRNIEGSSSYQFYYSPHSEVTDNLESVPSAFSVTAYPNPNRGETQLTLHSDKHEQITVSTYNIRGQKVKDQIIYANPNNTNSLSWYATDSSDKLLPNGVYILRITSPSHREIKKITVAK
jgi:hypothetical protein